jgi:UTP:GlnB (protein PII) uridylyltransferase
VRRAEEEGAPLAIETRVDPPRGSTEVTVYAADRLGLFSDLAGAFALAGADIVDARIFTLTNGKALDSFTIQDAGGPSSGPTSSPGSPPPSSMSSPILPAKEPGTSPFPRRPCPAAPSSSRSSPGC